MVWDRLKSKPGIVGPGSLKDATDGYGNTLLHLAAAADRVDLLRIGLKEGIDPTKKNLQGKTAGTIAVMHHHWAIAKILMDAEASKKD